MVRGGRTERTLDVGRGIAVSNEVRYLSVELSLEGCRCVNGEGEAGLPETRD